MSFLLGFRNSPVHSQSTLPAAVEGEFYFGILKWLNCQSNALQMLKID